MKASYESVDVEGRRVLLREDFNVPLRDRAITDDTRIRAALPTIRNLVDRGARVVVTSHLGRPKGEVNHELSLRPVADRLSELLGRPVAFAVDSAGPDAERVVAALRPGQLALLENVRFEAGEESNDPTYARALAAHGDVYVNDAFAASHRAHASVVGVADHLPAYAGALMEAELAALSRALDDPRRPLVAIVGGAKVSTKARVLRFLLAKVDALLVGGAMANTFFKAQGLEVGTSYTEDEALEEAREVVRLAGERLVLPVDGIAVQRLAAGQPAEVVDVNAIPAGWMVVDAGPRTRDLFATRVRDARTVVWNGPVGVFEIPDFATGTRSLGEAVAGSSAFSLLGGGDTAAAVEQLGLAGRFSHVSTGGGATLEYLEGRVLPGVAILREAVG